MPQNSTDRQILNNETRFEPKDLFFSTTDIKGIITSGNATFYRISEYSPEEALGKPHSLIRHPWMPQSAFKLLWSYLHEAKDVVVYVVNRTKTGKFYWVFAYVSPVLNERGRVEAYLSVRIKPSSKLLPVVQDLYKRTLEVEKDGGMDAGYAYLVGQILELGFSSYDHFMHEAVRSELSTTDLGATVLENVKIGSFLSKGTFGRVHYELSNTLLAQNKSVTASLKMEDAKNSIQTLLDETNRFFSIIKDASINMAICAGKLDGSSARSLRPVAFSLISMANKGAEMIPPFNETLQELLKNFELLCFTVGKNYIYSSSLLDEIDFFLKNEKELDEQKKECFHIFSKSLLLAVEQTDEYISNTQTHLKTLLGLVERELRAFTMKVTFLCMQGLVQAEAWNATDVINTLTELQSMTTPFEESLNTIMTSFQEVESILDLSVIATLRSRTSNEHLNISLLEVS